MSKDSIATIYRILTHRHHLLAHLLCLLLILSTPVLAQTTSDVTHAHSRFVPAVHNVFDVSSDDPCSNEIQYSVTFNPPQSGSTTDPFVSHIDPDLNLKAFSQGAGTPKDQRNTYDMGVDPATLTPEALDLNIFPTFEISAQLSLIPSLSYSPDHVMNRLSKVQYGAPKQWCNHYGEIVVMVGPTIEQKIPIGDPVNAGNAFSDTNRKPTPSELQIFFINASGQQVNFYPNPSEMGSGVNRNKPNTTNGQVTTWFSEDGTYQLVDKAAASATGSFDFELRTSSGLVLSFQPYAFDLDMDREALMRRFRVDQIHDRYQNFVDIVYRDENSAYQGEKRLQPWKARGFANGSNPGTDNPLSELEYLYDSRDRLKELKLPAYGSGQKQSFKFYYLDNGSIAQLPIPGGTINRLALNNIYSAPLNGTNEKLVLKPLKTLPGKIKNTGVPIGLFLDFNALGFVPETAVDFQNTLPNSLVFRSAPYQFHVVDNQNNIQLLKAAGQARQIYNQAAKIATLPDSILYRNRLDQAFYTSANVSASTYPDFITVSQTNLSSTDAVTVSILPRLKHGDVVAWSNSSDQVETRLLDVTGDNLIHHGNGDYLVPLQTGGTVLPDNSLYLIRQDQRDRIAEIEYPDAGSGSRKRMLFKYEEHSRNHAEIAEIYTFDDPVGTDPARLLSQTSYTYEQVLVQTAAEDLFEPETESLKRNCNMANRELAQPAGYKVESGIHLLRRHELLDILRHKRLRYYEPGLKTGNGVTYENYRDLQTYYGGAWKFALMGHSVENEALPAVDNNTCDRVEWGVAHRPFRFTWQINPDGSGQVFDLSADGVGLDPILAYANNGSRVFKTYQFDTNFKETFSNSAYGHFLGNSGRPFTPYYEYMPSYQVAPSATCTACTIPDLVRHPVWPGNRTVPGLKELFGFTGTNAYSASIQLFEPIPLYGYSLQTDILPNEPLKKLGLGTLHGSIHGGDQNTSTRMYFRASALKGLKTYLEENPNSGTTIIDKFFRGKFVSNIIPTDPPVGTTFPPDTDYNVAWAYGGRLNNSACFREIHQRQKNHRLRPHSQLSLQNLEGFEWDDAIELLKLDLDSTTNVSPYVIEATRFSNGGYIGEGRADSAVQPDPSNPAILTNISIPDEVTIYDFFYFDETLYKVIGIDRTSKELTFQPALVSTTELDKLKFYRFYDKNLPATHPYLGYDVFGNNAFKATYKRNQILFKHPQDKAAGDDHGLVPNFFDNAAVPFALSLNDSTDSANNDAGSWKFFGRVSRQFETGSLALHAETNLGLETIQSWRSGMLVDYIYSNVIAYNWLPTNLRRYFLPAQFGNDVQINKLNLTTLANIQLTTHVEDVQTAYRYYSPNGSTFSSSKPMNHGRVALEWTGKAKTRPSISQFSATSYDYDNAGWLAQKNSAVFKLNGSQFASDYGFRTLQTHDPATGLVIDDSMRVFNSPTWDGTVQEPVTGLNFSGSGSLRSRTKNTYDVLGRLTLTEAFDGNNQAFGNRIVTEYPNQTLTLTKTKGLDNLAEPFTTQYAQTNGLGQPTANLRQRGGDPNTIYATYTFYDAFSRPASVTSEQELINVSDPLTKTIGDASDQKGHTRSVYNRRGEVLGTVLYDGAKALQSNWVLKKQAADGNLTTYQIQQLPKEQADGSNSVAHLKIKALSLDKNGLLATVEDFHKSMTGNNPLWTTRTEAQLTTAMGDLTTATLMAKAAYTYDRMGKVVEAKVGTTNNQEQERTFFFDQRDRLRTEKHPEMPGVTIHYSNFDFFDNPTLIEHKDTSGILRSWSQTYDTAGNLLSSVALQPARQTITTHYSYHYSQDLAGQAHPFPEVPYAIRHSRNNIETFLYRHKLDNQRGTLLKRSLFHNRAGFPGESSVSLTSYNLESEDPPLLVNEGLDLSYTYDGLGRVLTMTYPTSVQGVTKATTLEFNYGGNGLLETVDDSAFQPKLNLIKDVAYGVSDQLTFVDYSHPNPTSSKNYLARTYDALNRLEKWKTVWSDGGLPSFSQSRDYSYDLAGRIHQIEIDKDPRPQTSDFKGYRYAYEGLAQIAEASFTNPDTLVTTTWDYGYDNQGFGNLEALKINGGNDILGTVSAATNRIETDSLYTPLGELEGYTDENSSAFTMTYNALGRLTSLRMQNTAALDTDYYYDHAGMRVFTKVEGTQANPEAKTLYFYDADGMVLCEWVSEKDGTTWQTPRWDRSYIYLAGKSSLTYEYDQAASGQGSGSSFPAGPVMTQAALVETPTFSWNGDAGLAYDLEVQNAENQTKGFYRQINGNSFTAPSTLKAGKYRARVRLADQVWGPWKETYYIPTQVQDLAADYCFDQQMLDRSFYDRHLVSSNLGFSEGKRREALHISANKILSVIRPHEFSTNQNGTVSFWIKLPSPSPTSPRGFDLLWAFGSLRLFANQNQNLQMNWSGQTFHSTTGTLNSGTWNHIAVVYGQSIVTVYLNNSQVFTTNQGPATYPFTSGEHTLGSKINAITWEGDIDELRIWNRNLSATEIQSEYTRVNGSN